MSNYSYDPLLNTERELRASPRYKGRVLSHLLSWSKQLRKQATKDPKQRAMLAVALASYSHMTAIQHELLGLSPLDKNAQKLSSALSVCAASLRQALRAAGLPKTGSENPSEPTRGEIFTPARDQNPTESERDRVA